MSLRPLLMLAAVLLLAAGCVYDPYTGTYVPCCAYPAYGYPYPPAGAPVAQPAPGRVEPEPPPAAYGSPQSYEAPATPQGGGKVAQRFAAANATGDGRLTLEQAQAARWQAVVRNFSAIDAGGKGYVTLADLRTWRAGRRQTAAAPGSAAE